MDELGEYIADARKTASNEIEKSRVESWVKGIWEYMMEGYHAYNQK